MAEIFKTPETPAPEQPAEKATPKPEPEPKPETAQRSIYERLATPPMNALDTIKAGNLKGKSDINPQWRIEAVTNIFGPCGVGWKFEIVEAHEKALADGQILLFMRVDFRYKQGGKWSDPIPGYGGDFIVEKNKNGLVPNDEAYKMCLTDALGNAMKCVGVAADIYRGLYDTKYNRHTEAPQQSQRPQQAQYQQAVPQAAQQPAPQQPQEPWTRVVNNRPQVRGRNGWVELTSCSAEMLQWILSMPNYAPVHQAANNLLMTGAL